MEIKQPTLLGHPKGLFYLAATEAWERFSYYGMTALVVLYMVNQFAAARTRSAHLWIFRVQNGGGIGRRSAFNPGARVADFRALLRFRLLHAAAWRHDRRSLDRTAQCCGDRRSLDECRSHRDDF